MENVMQQAQLNSIAAPIFPAKAVEIAGTPTHRDETAVRLVPMRRWSPFNFAELWRSRELLVFLAWRDVKVRYKQTVFGAAWAVLQPAMLMLAFTAFLKRMGGVSSGNLPYPLFVYAGLLPWTLFSTAVNGAGNSVLASERLVTKIYFPRLLIPLASVGTALIDFCVALGLMGILMIHYGTCGGLQMLLAPIVALIIVLTATGIGTFIAATTVRYRDIKYVLPFALQFWMFATPTIYEDTTGSKANGLRALLAANPVTGLITTFRATVLGGPIPWASALNCALFGIALFAIGCFYFQRVQERFADEI